MTTVKWEKKHEIDEKRKAAILRLCRKHVEAAKDENDPNDKYGILVREGVTYPGVELFVGNHGANFEWQHLHVKAQEQTLKPFLLAWVGRLRKKNIYRDQTPHYDRADLMREVAWYLEKVLQYVLEKDLESEPAEIVRRVHEKRNKLWPEGAPGYKGRVAPPPAAAECFVVHELSFEIARQSERLIAKAVKEKSTKEAKA